MGWPKQYGGRAEPNGDRRKLLMQQTIVNEELVPARAPSVIGMMGVQMVGPTLMQFGTEEQKRRYLPTILTAERDLVPGLLRARLRLGPRLAEDSRRAGRRRVRRQRPEGLDVERADRRLDVLPGAHRSDGAEAQGHLVRLDRHEDAPGITVRPLVQMTGDAGFNEVFFEDVRVPRENLVGELNQGWQVANATLAHERNMLGSTTRTQQMFDGLLHLARTRQRGGQAGERGPADAPEARRLSRSASRR